MDQLLHDIASPVAIPHHSARGPARRIAPVIAVAILVTCAAVSPATAQTTVTPTMVPTPVGASTYAQPGLLAQVSRLASASTPQAATNGADQAAAAVKTPSREKYLTIGLIGVGTAVAGVFVYRGGNDTPNLPGITNGRQTTGWVMVAAGSWIGISNLIRAFK